jgi:hypothetical protein
VPSIVGAVFSSGAVAIGQRNDTSGDSVGDFGLMMAALLTLAAILALFTATAALAQPDTYPPMTEGQAGALALRNACKGDIQRFCARELAPGGRILDCLRSHGDAISPVCRETAGALRAGGASGLDVPPGAAAASSGRNMPPPGATCRRGPRCWPRDACMMDAQNFARM